MEAQSYRYLMAASQAIQQGELDKAQSILGALLNENPHNAEAWFLLGGTIGDPRVVAICLRNALALDPHHDGAIKVMVHLEQTTGLKPLQVMHVGMGSAATGQTCPYCGSRFKALEEVVVCPKCQTSHHYGCWVENACGCAAVLCDGFSIREVYQQPLPLQPPESEPEEIVIRKEDISDGATATRKQQEQRFQRRLLLMALMAEEGQLPPEYADALPSVDEILDQVQRDRATGDQPTVTATAPVAPLTSETTSPLSPATPPSYQSSGIVTGIISIWPEQIQPENNAAKQSAKSCKNCGYDFRESKARFCPKCGTER